MHGACFNTDTTTNIHTYMHTRVHTYAVIPEQLVCTFNTCAYTQTTYIILVYAYMHTYSAHMYMKIRTYTHAMYIYTYTCMYTVADVAMVMGFYLMVLVLIRNPITLLARVCHHQSMVCHCQPWPVIVNHGPSSSSYLRMILFEWSSTPKPSKYW